MAESAGSERHPRVVVPRQLQSYSTSLSLLEARWVAMAARAPAFPQIGPASLDHRLGPSVSRRAARVLRPHPGGRASSNRPGRRRRVMA